MQNDDKYDTIYNQSHEKAVAVLFSLRTPGCEKTTWVRHEFSDAYTIDLLNESLYQSYLANISLFANELRTVASGRWIFVDEIQRLPNLLNEVHRFIEERRLNFILTYSSARKLKRADVNLLAGRAILRRMHPFIPSEEVKAEALARNLPGFARFLPVAAVLHGQTVNVSGAARDAEISRTTLSGYIEILEDTLLAFCLPAFEGKLRVRERKHPKLYWIDPGLVRAMGNRFGSLHPEERGVLFEGWMPSLLRAHRDYTGLFDEFYYWAPATARQTEVDFLLRRDERYNAIETKNSA